MAVLTDPKAVAAVGQIVLDGDVEELAMLHLELTAERRQIGDLCREVEERLAEVMPAKTLELPGLPVMERRSGRQRVAWQSDVLFDRLYDQILQDGDVTGGRARLRACLPITPSLGWRVTGLRDAGIDPDEWCETKPGRVTVQIHEAAS